MSGQINITITADRNAILAGINQATGFSGRTIVYKWLDHITLQRLQHAIDVSKIAPGKVNFFLVDEREEKVLNFCESLGISRGKLVALLIQDMALSRGEKT